MSDRPDTLFIRSVKFTDRDCEITLSNGAKLGLVTEVEASVSTDSMTQCTFSAYVETVTEEPL